MISPEGQLLILASRDLQSAEQLAASGGLDPIETNLQLGRPAGQGCIIASDPAADAATHRLEPESAPTDELDPSRRILLVESDLPLGELLTMVLEDEGYATITVHTPAEAVVILSRVSFDLVVTDGFSKTVGAVVGNLAELREAARATPVVLFTAHRLDLDDVLAAGFRDLIEKPFELETLERSIRALLPLGSPQAARVNA